jgi:hypothetical protein
MRMGSCEIATNASFHPYAKLLLALSRACPPNSVDLKSANFEVRGLGTGTGHLGGEGEIRQDTSDGQAKNYGKDGT